MEDGEVFDGEAAGFLPPDGVSTGELVFNTSMSGYQEVLSDPSYSGQVVCFTYPHIGSYGVTPDDDEARRIWTRGFVVRDLPPRPSNWRASGSLESMLESRGVPGITGIDTRRVARRVRSKGAVACAFGTASLQVLEEAAAMEPGTTDMDLVTGATGVSTTELYVVGSGALRVVAYDFGVKSTTLRCLAELATVTVVPADTPAGDALGIEPDGIFLSNGPGDPSALERQVSTVSDLLGRIPIFGICLGHQLLATALGASTYKLPFGHHGGNHPVRALDTGRVEITAQNHNYAVSAQSLGGLAEITHVNLNDGVVEGIRAQSAPTFGVQYHPEAGPGPHDARYLFESFRSLMDGHSQRPRWRRQGGGRLMPKRTDIESILVIGSGPIVIGQACEFDYSGTQACRVLRAEGYRVILANSNPATIMTDPEVADRTYVEPLVAEVIAAIIARERPDVLLPTLGGQTALNLAMELSDSGVLEAAGVSLIGANADAIRTAEDRDLFKAAMEEIGLEVPASGFATTLDEAVAVGERIGFPIMVRPSFILGGSGTGIAYDRDELVQVSARGLAASPVHRVLVERSIAGWKEFELEVMRDRRDNCVVVCSIENLDPMGVHTGDSITVAPAQTLSDVEYQQMRDDAFACIRRVGVETGGSNIQFAVSPEDGKRLVIEMNPRVSRSSALASKATGFPIAKIAARLAVGYTLDEITNDITGATPASFEPAIDYVVTKIPRWAFEKLPGAPDSLGTRMQSVGEVMAIGRTFPESLQKAIRSLEQGRSGLNADPAERKTDELDDEELLERTAQPTPERVFELEAALRRGVPVDLLAERTGVDRWFLDQLEIISSARVTLEKDVATRGGPQVLASLDRRAWRGLERAGFSDAQHRVLAFDSRCPRGRVTGALSTPGSGSFSHLQDGRHMCCGVRSPHSIPLLDLRGRGRGEAEHGPEGRHIGFGPEPDRAGYRVRLLLRARELGTQGRGIRDGHGQLQSRDGLHRLRHVGPSVLRAAHC